MGKISAARYVASQAPAETCLRICTITFCQTGNFLYTAPETTDCEQNMLLPAVLYKNSWSIIFLLSILRANYIPLSFKFFIIRLHQFLT